MNILYIDTSDNKKTIVKLSGDIVDEVIHQSNDHKSQVVLSLIDTILKKNKVFLKNIDELQINTGPGSFTGIRVGIAIANALSYAKNISVNGKPLENYADARYA